MKIPRPHVGLAELLEDVSVDRSFDGFAARAGELRDARAAAGIDVSAAARVVKIPAPALAFILSGRRAFKTPEAYDVALDRLRSDARRRAQLGPSR